MAISYVVSISDAVSHNLASKQSAKDFYKGYLSKIMVHSIIIDFRNAQTIDYSFACQYWICKKYSKKTIREINVCPHICQTLEVAKNDINFPKKTFSKPLLTSQFIQTL